MSQNSKPLYHFSINITEIIESRGYSAANEKIYFVAEEDYISDSETKSNLDDANRSADGLVIESGTFAGDIGDLFEMSAIAPSFRVEFRKLRSNILSQIRKFKASFSFALGKKAYESGFGDSFFERFERLINTKLVRMIRRHSEKRSKETSK